MSGKLLWKKMHFSLFFFWHCHRCGIDRFLPYLWQLWICCLVWVWRENKYGIIQIWWCNYAAITRQHENYAVTYSGRLLQLLSVLHEMLWVFCRVIWHFWLHSFINVFVIVRTDAFNTTLLWSCLGETQWYYSIESKVTIGWCCLNVVERNYFLWRTVTGLLCLCTGF